MFKKTEESEWTRFSRALGNQPSPPLEDEQAQADEPEEAVTLSQAPPVEPETYVPPPPPDREPEPAEPPMPTHSPPTVAAAPSGPSLSRQPDVDHDETVVGDGASIEGTVRSDRSIRVRGAVQGEIESQQQVTVEEQARVQARITAAQVMVQGEVNGSINCTGRVEIASTARVTGEVTAGRLVIQEGAFFEGSLKMANQADDA